MSFPGPLPPLDPSGVASFPPKNAAASRAFSHVPEACASTYDATPVDALALLRTWCDGLLVYQVASGPEAGGFYCPAHRIFHGRGGDAVYPLLALYRRTGEGRYLAAARAVYDWSERRVSRPDGSWINEPDGRNDWPGITCFRVLTLGETLRHHGDALTAEETEGWRERIRRAADFLMRFQTFEVGPLNYPVGAGVALALAGTLLDEPRFLARARELIVFSLGHFTVNRLIWGEGARGPNDVSPRGLRSIDLPYNVAETIPLFALYAELTGDAAVRDAAVASLGAHFEWMLPDGGWDAGWCSRVGKWTYWSSRTTEGSVGAFALLQSRDPRFATAADRQIRIQAANTHGGLLLGGLHLRSRGLPPCIHPTFTHAKGLAMALDAGLVAPSPGAALPSETASGVRVWPEAGVTRVALGPWRASVTVNDIPCTDKRGGYPSGGAVCLLWHERTGLLLAASLTDYVRYEPENMDEAALPSDRFVLTPRIELHRGGVLYSNLHDRSAELSANESADGIEVVARGVLRDASGRPPPDGAAVFELHYTFTPTAFVVAVRAVEGARIYLPISCPADERIQWTDAHRVELHKPGALVRVSSSPVPFVAPAMARVFNFVPGIEAVPLSCALSPDGTTSVRMEVF